MIEIEFRGKDKAKKWHHGSLINKFDTDALCVLSSYIIEKYDFSISADNNTSLYDVVCLDDYYEVDKNTVGQFTGLKDKNGTKIFEGDILKGSWFTVFVVYYDDCYLQYRGKYKFGDNEISYYGNSEKLEVIGNIYDNPELLEVQNELRETND